MMLPHGISDKIREPFFLLQYADDTMLFSTAKGIAVQLAKQVLDTFSLVSGIRLNSNKSCFITFNITERQQEGIKAILQMEATVLPFNYLGLPLTLRKPERLMYQALIDKVQCRLAGWKSSMLSRAGRVVLASSVLSTIPIYFMSVFKLPTWVVKALDRLRRDFIWGSSNNSGRSMHLLSWDRVCLPKPLGGFGLLDLRLHNIALLLRWWWRLHHDPDTLWSKLARRLFAKRDVNLPPLAWNLCGSFFWKDLLSLRFYFQLSSTSVIGTGLNTLFWYNNWGGTPLFYCLSHPKPPSRRFITLRAAVPLLQELLPAPLTLQQSNLVELANNLNFSTLPDRVDWRWTNHGKYSAASTYKAFMFSGKVLSPLRFLWKIKIPPSVKLFLLLLAHGRLLTQDQLLRRNIPCTQGCVMCTQMICETAGHLFLDCTFATRLWNVLGYPESGSDPNASLQDKLLTRFAAANNSADKLALIATTFWGLWLERNNRVFRNQSRHLGAVHHWIICESTLFVKYC
ncbi:RNA-directed DNA polymerase (reverse transcriptase)-related family protein [Rhynchospora pubera]|uniref:RNA-directed DNA polymerase (Reverse transcriptase)-related family protein n=1 Tax=Rhynchospora pubera TaxID=906938 RepID=A0AAV8DNC4_9POAL|nr:RNA-directed DNA polymerase (reverse transcriptase)-related family protein [Rhynchospora pubera]